MIEIDKDEIKHSLNNNIKIQVKEFIKGLNLGRDINEKVDKELGSNWADGLFDVDGIINRSVESIVWSLKGQKSGRESLWEEVAINASKHSDHPEIIADNVVERKEKNFESDEYGSKWKLKIES